MTRTKLHLTVLALVVGSFIAGRWSSGGPEHDAPAVVQAHVVMPQVVLTSPTPKRDNAIAAHLAGKASCSAPAAEGSESNASSQLADSSELL